MAKRPASARLIAAIAGPSVQLEMPCRISARYTNSGIGCTANINALAVNTSTLNAATRVLFSMASTRAPAGTWLAIELTVPMLSAKPIAVCVQLWLLR